MSNLGAQNSSWLGESYNERLDKRLVDAFVCLRMEGLSKRETINKIVRDFCRGGKMVTEDYVRGVLE